MPDSLLSVQTITLDSQTVQAVSAKDLYDFLGLRKDNFSRWLSNIEAKGIEGQDYIPSTVMYELSRDLILSIDFAKGISMMTSSKKGDEVRQYFINVEKSFKKIIERPAVPQTYLEALKAAVIAQEQLEATGVKLIEAENKLATLSHTGKLYTATEIAKELGMKSATQLNATLEDMGLQHKVNGTWVLRSWLSDKGYTSIKQMELESGRIVYDRKWTQAGREFILTKMNGTTIKQIQ